MEASLRATINVCVTLNAAPTLSGLRVFGVGGVCLLQVVAGPERKQVSTVSLKATRKDTEPLFAFQTWPRTWSSGVRPCSSGGRRGAAARAGPGSHRQRCLAAPAAARSSPPGLKTQEPPEEEADATGACKDCTHSHGGAMGRVQPGRCVC